MLSDDLYLCTSVRRCQARRPTCMYPRQGFVLRSEEKGNRPGARSAGSDGYGTDCRCNCTKAHKTSRSRRRSSQVSSRLMSRNPVHRKSNGWRAAIVACCLGTVPALWMVKAGMRTDANADVAALHVRLRVLEDNFSSATARLTAVRLSGYTNLSGPTNSVFTPGWLVKAYSPQKFSQERLGGEDLGAFFLDEDVFHLRVHEYHGIKQPYPLAYKLNSLFAVRVSGKFQFGVRIRSGLPQVDSPRRIEPPRCRVSLGVGATTVVHENVNFSARGRNDLTLTGSIALEPGLHPTEAVVWCDKQHPEAAANVTFSFLARAPGESRFSRDAATFLHVLTGAVVSPEAQPALPERTDLRDFRVGHDRQFDSGTWALVHASGQNLAHQFAD